MFQGGWSVWYWFESTTILKSFLSIYNALKILTDTSFTVKDLEVMPMNMNVIEKKNSSSHGCIIL